MHRTAREVSSLSPRQGVGRRKIRVGLIALAAGVVAWPMTSSASAHPDVGLPFLLIWPSTRATAIAGAMTGLADDAEAAYWNPGGLAYQKGLRGVGALYSWFPESHPGMFYDYASLGYGFPALRRDDVGMNVGASLSHISLGEVDIVNERGQFLGRYTSYRFAVGPHCGIRLREDVGVGLAVKLVRSFLGSDWYAGQDDLWWKGIDGFGSGVTVAVDIGALYRPVKAVSIGLALANFGPGISYTSSGESDRMPCVLRLGACATPVDVSWLHINGVAQVERILDGSRLSELQGTRVAIGAEANLARLLALRCGYSVGPSAGRSGLCWGFGVGWKIIGLEFAVDGLTDSWRLAIRGPWLGRT